MPVSRSLIAVTFGTLISLVFVTVVSAQAQPDNVKAAEPAAAAATAADEKEPQPTQKPLTAEERAKFISIHGTVFREDGTAARWSQVWLAGMTTLFGNQTIATQIAFVRADVNGKFEFWHPRSRENFFGRNAISTLYVVARTRDGTLTMNRTLNLNGEYRDQTEIRDLKLNVLPKADYSGRVVDEKGSPIPNAKVTPKFLVFPPNIAMQKLTMTWFPELSAKYSAVTNAEGKFTLIGLPRSTNISAEILVPEVAMREMSWDLTTQPELSIESSGIIRGMLTNLPDEKFCSHIELDIRIANRLVRGNLEPSTVFVTRCQPETDGRFEIADVPRGRYQVSIVSRDGVSSISQQFIASVNCEVQPGQINDDVKLTIPEVIVVRGMVVENKSGEKIANAEVLFYESLEQPRTLKLTTMSTTNADGEYRAYVPPGKIVVRFGRPPDGYLTPKPIRRDAAEVAVMRTESFEGPTLRLDRDGQLDGTVIDEDGHPVAGAEIRWILPLRQRNKLRTDLKSDESGHFRISQIDPQKPLLIGVRTKTGVSTSLVIASSDLDKPQQIVVSPRNAFRLKGKLTDRRGQPIPNAETSIHWHRTSISERIPMSSSYGELEKHKTDNDGRFESLLLWPEDGYHVVIKADGFLNVELPLVKGKMGEVHDYGTVQLVDTNRVIEGKVVDSNGKPIADATVFNSGDATQIVSTLTNQEGRFRLGGLRSGGVHFFVEHPDYRFGGTYANEETDNVSLTLTSLTVPPPMRTAVDFDAIDVVQKQQAQQLLEWAKSANLKVRPDLQDSKFVALVKSDPDKALIRIERQWAGMGRRNAMLAVQSLTPFQSRIFGDDELSQKNAKLALKLLEQVASSIGDSDPRGQMFNKAEVGMMFFRLGDAVRGKEFVEAAAKVWHDDPKLLDARNDFTVITIAQSMAWVDIDRAVGYLERVRDEFRNSTIRRRVILEVSRFNVPRALELLADPKYGPAKEGLDDSLRLDLAYRIGRVDPQKAADLVASITDPQIKAQAYGWAAVAVAEVNPDLARSLIDRGLLSLKHHREPSSRSFHSEYVAGVAAHLALQASQINHPEIESIIQQALALRMPADPRTSAKRHQQSAINAALFLGFVDPVISKRLLIDLEPELKVGDFGEAGVGSAGKRDWFNAWVLADPEYAAKLLQPEIEKLKGSNYQPGENSVVTMPWALMFLPRSEQLDYVRKNSSANLVIPYKE